MAGSDLFAALHEAEPGTFYLTDFLAKHFDALVWGSLGLDRHPELRDAYFGNYRRVVLLSQTDDPAVEAAGRRAAEMLGLEFEHLHVGREPFAAAVSVSVAAEGRLMPRRERGASSRSSPSTGATSRPRSTARTAASVTRCCCRRNSNAPSTAPSARPGSTPPKKTSPSGTARARPATTTCSRPRRRRRRSRPSTRRSTSASSPTPAGSSPTCPTTTSTGTN